MTLIDQIRDLIAEGDTERSLDELYNYVKANNADVIDNLVMLRSRMQNLQRSVSNGTMDDQTAALERAKINEAILKLLPQLTPEYLAQASQRREPVRPAAPYVAPAAPARDIKKMYLIGGGVLLVVVLLIIMFSGGGDSEGSEMSAEQTVAADDVSAAAESWAPEEGSLLYNVMANHSGYAVWSSVYDETNGQSIFRLENEKTWQEIKNGQVTSTYAMVANSDTYVTLHDPTRKMFVRIGETNAEYHSEDDPSWYILYDNGEWITPPDAQ